MYAGPTMFGIQYNMFNTPMTIKSTIPDLNDVHTNRALHHTFLFNTFMMMQLFNQLNCRKIGSKEVNIFERFFNNFLFLLILGAEFALQWFIVDIGYFFKVGQEIFQTTPQPFSMTLAAVLFGAGTLLVGYIAKMTPDRFLEKIKIEIQEDQVEEEKDIISRAFAKITGSMKRSETERLLE